MRKNGSVRSKQKRPENRHRRPSASPPLYFLFLFDFGRILQIYFFNFLAEVAQYESSYCRTVHHAPDPNKKCINPAVAITVIAAD